MLNLVTGKSLSGKTTSMINIALKHAENGKKVVFLHSNNSSIISKLWTLGINPYNYTEILFARYDNDINDIIRNMYKLSQELIDVIFIDGICYANDRMHIVQHMNEISKDYKNIDLYLENYEYDSCGINDNKSHQGNINIIKCELDDNLRTITYKKGNEEIVKLKGFFNKNIHYGNNTKIQH